MSQIQDGKTFNLHPVRSKSNPYRILLLVCLILGGIWLLLQLNRGQVQSPFNPTPTPTRSPQSYIMAAQAYFASGKLDDPASDQDAIGATNRRFRLTRRMPWRAELAYSDLFSSTQYRPGASGPAAGSP
jgi:hypothetical protein